MYIFPKIFHNLILITCEVGREDAIIPILQILPSDLVIFQNQ